jgi:RNA polymerase sigma factor (sigma-70 family)
MTENHSPGLLDVAAAMEQYADMVRRICFLYLKHREDVEDVFQEVFLRYMQRREPFASDEHEKAWLLRVAINCCKDLVGSFWYRRTIPLDEDLMAEIPTESHEILDAIQRLPSSERTSIYLFYYEGYTAVEIAKMQNQKINTVYSHLNRARKRLRKQLGGIIHEENDPENV